MQLGGTFKPQAYALFAIAAALAASLLTSSPADAAGTARISGIVSASDGSGPIQDIKVCSAGACAQTADNGSYAIDVRTGVHYPSAVDTSEVFIDQYGEKTPNLAAGANFRQDFHMVRGASITGTLSLPAGVHPTGRWGEIHAYPVDSTGKAASVSISTGFSYSPRFTVNQLPPGKYKLEFTGENNYARQWYPSAAVASAGTALTVTEGQQVAVGEVGLVPPSTVAVRLMHSRTPTTGNVDLYDSDGRTIELARSSNAQGVATFEGLAAGRYRARGHADAAGGYAQWWSFRWDTSFVVDAGQTATPTIAFKWPTLTAKTRPTLTVYPDMLFVNAINKPPYSYGTWNATPTAYTFAWYRDGVRIPGQWSSINIRKADLGHRIMGCAIAMRPGYAKGMSCTAYSPTLKKSKYGTYK